MLLLNRASGTCFWRAGAKNCVCSYGSREVKEMGPFVAHAHHSERLSGLFARSVFQSKEIRLIDRYRLFILYSRSYTITSVFLPTSINLIPYNVMKDVFGKVLQRKESTLSGKTEN